MLDDKRLANWSNDKRVTQIYQLAALLSVTGEQAPLKAWTLNMNGLLNVLEMARKQGQAGKPLKVFWPSSIAAFGPHTPALDTPQFTVMDPTTIYGISKQAGERLCEYYFSKFGVDVRSIRYPGIISHKSPPGGGTTDYAIAIFHAACAARRYKCFLGPESTLPMIYMPDAIRATIELMDAPTATGAHSFVVQRRRRVASIRVNWQQAIRRHLPRFEIDYQPDQRQAIADTWPRSIDDAHAASRLGLAGARRYRRDWSRTCWITSRFPGGR